MKKEITNITSVKKETENIKKDKNTHSVDRWTPIALKLALEKSEEKD
ncbi:MAG: hypothetical protein NTY51_04790 [Deltaproteobacteria bacterium]|nr:hypothetical protein [Deltaproteobacteria bacterium]